MTALTDSHPSHNIEFLTKLFEKQQNIDILLCSSSLFEHAREEQWGDLSTTRLRNNIAATLSELEFNQMLRDRHSSEHGEPEKLGNAVSDDPLLEKLLSYTSKASDSNYNLRPTSTEAHAGSSERDEQRLQQGDRQLSAKLHCLYGMSIGTIRKASESSPPRYSLRHDTADICPYARARVYDLRQHTEDGTFWGPFLDDGLQNVDWEKIEAIMIILDYNLRRSVDAHRQYEDVLELQEKPWVGAMPNSFVSQPQSMTMEPALPLEAQDPYNITGTWMRIVCFLDYTELYDFNFGSDPPESNQPRPPLDTEEATRMIIMKLRITKIEAPGEDQGQQLPVVHFQGKSSSIRPSWDPNANSKIKGRNHFSSLLEKDMLTRIRYGELDAAGRSKMDNLFRLPRVRLPNALNLLNQRLPLTHHAAKSAGGAKASKSEASGPPAAS